METIEPAETMEQIPAGSGEQKQGGRLAALFSSSRMDWATPPEVFDPLNQRYRFTLDACANESNAKVENFISESDDALTVPWLGRVWCNPPYGRGIGKWLEKAFVESQLNAELVVCLVPARTDTAWFHDWALRGQVTFLRGRIKFVGAKHAAPFPSMIIEFNRSNFSAITKRELGVGNHDV